MLALTVEDILQDAGAKIAGPFMTTEAALRGLEELGSEPVAAALLDINIQGQSSYVIADALTARAVPVLFATGYGATNWQHGKDGAAPVVISKPYQPHDLVSALKDLITN
ncbi:MAG: response regulator [Pseudomonadota bacterium]